MYRKVGVFHRHHQEDIRKTLQKFTAIQPEKYCLVQISFLTWPPFLSWKHSLIFWGVHFSVGNPYKPWPGQSIRINGHGFSILGIPWSRQAKTIERIVYPGIVDEVNPYSWWFKVTFLGWLSEPFKGLSDLQLGDEKGTLNHLAEIIHSQDRLWGFLFLLSLWMIRSCKIFTKCFRLQLVGWLGIYLPATWNNKFEVEMKTSPPGDSSRDLFGKVKWPCEGCWWPRTIRDKKVHSLNHQVQGFSLSHFENFVPKKWYVIIVIQLLFKGQKHVVPFCIWWPFGSFSRMTGVCVVCRRSHREIPWKQQFATQVLGDFFHENQEVTLLHL